MKLAVAISLTVASLLSSFNAEARQTPLEFAKEKQAAIFTSCQRSAAEIDQAVDYHSMVVNSFQSNWRSFSERQREEIEIHLTRIIRGSLQKRFKRSPGSKVTWIGSDSPSENVYIARSVVETVLPVQEKFEIDYVIVPNQFSYKVIDVIFDGISTVENYSRQFQTLIRKRGVDSLIQKLKEKSQQNLIDDDDGC